MRTLIKADRLIDGTGAAPLANGALVIEDKRVSVVTTQDLLGSAGQGEWETIEVPGGTILPGFVQVHSHIHCSGDADVYRQVTTESDHVLLMRAVQAVRAALGSGVTCMRDLGSKNDIALAIRQAIDEGVIPGPRLLVAGTPITTTGGHCHMFGTEADALEEVVSAVRRQVKLGADWIKIMATGGRFTPRTNPRSAQYPVETLRAAVQDARRLGIRVAAHCHGADGVRNSVEAGVDNLIHATWMSADPTQDYDYDPGLADSIAEKGIYVDPTIATQHLMELRNPGWLQRSQPNIFVDPERRYEVLRDMWDRGVKFVTGLDSGMEHVGFDDFAYMPQLMVEKMELSPLDAIVSATKTSAECLGVLDETGTLEVGKLADVAVVQGNPITDIRALHTVDTVIKQGKVVKRNGSMLV